MKPLYLQQSLNRVHDIMHCDFCESSTAVSFYLRVLDLTPVFFLSFTAQSAEVLADAS